MEMKKNETAASTNSIGGARQDDSQLGVRPAGVGAAGARPKESAIGGGKSNTPGVSGDVLAGSPASTGAPGMNGAAKAAKPINPTTEHEYWRNEGKNRSYCMSGTPYEQYGPAFQFGWESFASHKGKEFKDMEAQMERDWDSRRGVSKLNWNQVKGATRDAWMRVEKAACGDTCSSA